MQKEICFLPPQSPDLNPLDYKIWMQISSKTCKCRYNSIEDLKAAVNRTWCSMRKDYIPKVFKEFWLRLNAVVDMMGSHIKETFCFKILLYVFSDICFFSPLKSKIEQFKPKIQKCNKTLDQIRTQHWCKDNFPSLISKEVWPPSFINALNYFM